jgi:N-methylhydantoinase A
MASRRHIGVDTGGTFTDCVLVDHEERRVTIAKLPSEPSAPQTAILTGLDELLSGDDAGPVESVIHGTTIATNCVITGDLARVGLITTRGFRDVLEIGTQMRQSLYRLDASSPATLVPRELRLEVAGRIAADGTEIEALDLDEVAAVAECLREADVEAVAVACLFSYRNPAQETAIQQELTGRLPGVYVGRSSGVSREPREYQRFATAVVNAALSPRIDPYVRTLEAHVRDDGIAEQLYVMQSNGGVATAARSVGENVHQLVLSGPAAGVIGGAWAAASSGYQSCVTFDVGGTSADIGLVTDGRPRTAFDMTLPNGLPCKVAHIEVDTIGAGGGSIAAVDAGGALTVGPLSAGADPGPACYGRGGTEPTVTDAHLLLGRLSGRGLIGGRLTLDAARAREAIRGLADALGTSVTDAAMGMLVVLEQNMIGAIRRSAARHGEDLRDHVLVAGGGAGPLHAAEVARSLGISRVLVPPNPGLLSALGLLGAHIRHDLSQPLLIAATELDELQLETAFGELEALAAAALDEDRVPAGARRFERVVDVRYVGQEYALEVPLAAGGGVAELLPAFHRRHEQTFGHCAPEQPTETVAARLVALGVRDVPRIRRDLPSAAGAPHSEREVHFAGAGALATPVYARETLALSQYLEGPAIIEQLDTTTVLPPGTHALVDETASMIVTVEELR